MTELGTPKHESSVLMIGAGGRAQNSFLPVLDYLSRHDSFRIAGIHSRTAARLIPVADRWGIPAIERLQEFDLGSVNVVAISVPIAQNPIVLQSLYAHRDHLTIVIDTPVAWNRNELRTIIPLLSKFRRVLVAEDYMNFPSFTLLRQAARDGLIGKLHGVTLNNIGFLYHGLALIRSFCGFEYVQSSWNRRVSSFSCITGYSFERGFKGVIVGPYRRHRSGGITVEGATGILTDFPGDRDFEGPGKGAVYSLNCHRTEDGFIHRITLDGPGSKYQIETPELVEIAHMDFADKSDLNLLRACGLANIFRAIHEPDNLNNAYGPRNALYDSFASQIAERRMIPFNSLVWLGVGSYAAMHA